MFHQLLIVDAKLPTFFPSKSETLIFAKPSVKTGFVPERRKKTGTGFFIGNFWIRNFFGFGVFGGRPKFIGTKKFRIGSAAGSGSGRGWSGSGMSNGGGDGGKGCYLSLPSYFEFWMI